jgi:hypothetical protein
MLTPTTHIYIKVATWKGPTEAQAEPYGPSKKSKQSDDWHEIACQTVRDAFYRRSFCLTVAHHVDDMIEPVLT